LRTTDREKFWANFFLEGLRIWKGKAAFSGGLLLIATGAFLVRPDLFWGIFALLGFITTKEAMEASSPSIGMIILAGLCFVLGVVLIIFGTIGERFATKKKTAPVVALRHQSFDGLTRALASQDLPSDLTASEIKPMEIDQTSFYRNGLMEDPAAAMRQQDRVATQLQAHIKAHPDVMVAYHGKAHIPYAFAAGYAAQADVPAILYELNRKNGDWILLEKDGGGDLGLTVERSGEPVRGGDAVIRISISYPVGLPEVLEVVAAPQPDIHIRIRELRIDAVSSRAQADEIANAFRKVLDDLHNSATRPARIHVFCAAPMSVVFSLGRRVSPTIHPPVIIYNYSAAATPRYAWAVQVNGAGAPRVIEQAPTVA
jgi:hypothetical protein